MTGTLTVLKEFQSREHASVGRIVCDPVRTVEQAYREGLADGETLARAEVDQETTAMIGAMISRLSEAMEIRDSISRYAFNDASAAVAAVVRAICPKLAEKGLVSSVEALVLDELQKVPRPLVVKVAPESLDGLVAVLSDHLDDEVSVEAEEGRSPQDVQIEWFQGSASVQVGAIVEQILSLLDPLDQTNITNNQGEA